MEMHQIRYFLAVAETLNFTRAAEQCHVTQPALTRAIQKLEEELGGLLFRRERGLSHLTDLGRIMRPHLEHVLNETEAAKTTARSMLKLDHAPLNLGVMCTIGPVRFVSFLTRFRELNPGVEVAAVEGVPARLTDMLLEGQIDIAVMAQPEPFHERFDAKPLFSEHFMVGFPPGHRFAERNAVALSELRGERYLARVNCEFRDHIKALREKHGAIVEFAFRSERDDWIQVMCAAGLGFCILPESLALMPGLLTRRIVEPEIERTVCLVTVAGRRFSPAAAAFVRAIRAHRWDP